MPAFNWYTAQQHMPRPLGRMLISVRHKSIRVEVLQA